MTVWEDDKIVATGGIAVSDSHRPLPESVHKLSAVDDGKAELRWSSMDYGKSDREDLARELRRIKSEPMVREEARKRLHHGTALVTTNESSTVAHRTSRDFVIIDGIY